MKRTLKAIRDACRDDGGCWIWRLSVNNKGYPQACFDGKPGQMVRRVAYLLAGKKIAEGHIVTGDCSKRCCNPWHLRAATYSDVVSKSYEKGLRSPAGHISRVRSMIDQGKTKLNHDIARDIRSSDESNAKLADKYGVCKKTIYAVRSGRTWKPQMPNSSAWSMTWR